MNENISLFLKKLAENKDLQAKAASAATPDALYELAQAVQDGFTKEELLDALRSLAENADQDLDAADLAKTAGGMRIAATIPQLSLSVTGEPQSIFQTLTGAGATLGNADGALGVKR